MPRTIKVKLKNTVNSYRLGDVSHKPGDIFKIPERLFRPDFFEKWPPPAPPIVKEEVVEETAPEEKPGEGPDTEKGKGDEKPGEAAEKAGDEKRETKT